MTVWRIVLLAAVLLAASCGAEQTESGRIEVVAAFYPVAEATERVGGEDVEVTNLTPAGAEPHDIELTSSQLDRVIDADVVLYLGRGFQPALEQALPQATGVVVDLLEGQRLEEGEAHDHDEGEEEAHEDEAVDPHIWLDPLRWAEVVERVADVLVEVDPEGAGSYADRADAYAAELEALHADFAAGLADCDRRLVVTSHAAFSYLAGRYGLEEQAVSRIAPEAEPAPDRLAELADLIEREGVTTVYTETRASPQVARTLARETGVTVSTLDPIEGLTTEQIDRGEDYASVMRQNLEALRDGLGCS